MYVPRAQRLCRRFPTRGVRGFAARGGFTLLEVTVALAVLTIAALGVLSCLTTGYAVDREASDAIGAQNMARQLMEELLKAPFSTMMATYDNTQVTQNTLRATLRVQRIAPATGPASLLRLQVTVRNIGQGFDLVRMVGQRADHSAPSSAWSANP
jgi:prepilin-type N-terminal cleavage/methylation domain-containing protein